MAYRVVEIQENGSYLSLFRGFLIINIEKKEIGRIPLDEIAVVITNSYQLTYSHALLLELSKRNIAFIACGDNHLPIAAFWPITTHYYQAAVMHSQINSSQPISKQLWRIIITAKILRQQEVLDKANIKGGNLIELSKQVNSGDTQNLEAQAARQYWLLLFGKKFTRNITEKNINSLLNYGYAIIRSGIARAIMATGLHPTFGIFHKNLANPFCLVDDLMEPYRPIVDWEVYQFHKIGITELNKDIKTKLASILIKECNFNGNKVPISMAMQYTAQSLSLCYKESDYKKLQLPDRLLVYPDDK